MHRSMWLAVAATITAATVIVSAQIGGKPVRGGNPTPGTPQPDPPNLADRITLTGCLQPAPNAGPALDVDTPSDARFVLTDAQRLDKNPPGTGGSALAARTVARRFRLHGIVSQFSPFVNTKVEISGEVRSSSNAGADGNNSPTLLVEFIHKLASSCT